MDGTFAMDTVTTGTELQRSRPCQEVTLLLPPDIHGSRQPSLPGSRRMTVDQHIESFNVSRRQSTEPGPDYEFRMRNQRIGDDVLTTTLSAFYAKFLVMLGIAFPVTDILSQKAPQYFYRGFYLYLYIGSVAFVVYMCYSLT